MINKIKSLAVAAILVLFGSAQSYAVDSFAVGISGSWGVYEADGSETVATSKQTDEGAIELVLGSIFAEADMGAVTIGLDYIPMEADSATVTNVRADTVSTGTNTASVTVSDHVTVYAILPLSDLGIFARLGYSEMTVETNENLATGGSYGDLTVNGYHAGIGYEMDMNSEVFVRASLDYHDYEEMSATNKNNSAVKVTADLDGYSAGISVGRRF